MQFRISVFAATANTAGQRTSSRRMVRPFWFSRSILHTGFVVGGMTFLAACSMQPSEQDASPNNIDKIKEQVTFLNEQVANLRVVLYSQENGPDSYKASIDSLAQKISDLNQRISVLENGRDQNGSVPDQNTPTLQNTIDQMKEKLDRIYICPQQLNDAISAVPCQ